MTENLIIIQWVDGSITHVAPIELISSSSQFSTTGITNAGVL